MSGDPPFSLYAVSGVRLPGPNWWAVRNLSAAQYQAKFNEFCLKIAGNNFRKN
jgi:hypothetical protein